MPSPHEGDPVMRLKGRVAAITGGALGIGRATAQLFAAEGAAVVLGDVQTAAAEAVMKEIARTGGQAITVEVDVGDAGQVQAFVDRAVAEFGRLDVMFANAGIAHSAPFLEHPEAQWHRVLRVNLTGVFLCCQAAARQMVKQGGGRIITTASINGSREACLRRRGAGAWTVSPWGASASPRTWRGPPSSSPPTTRATSPGTPWRWMAAIWRAVSGR